MDNTQGNELPGESDCCETITFTTRIKASPGWSVKIKNVRLWRDSSLPDAWLLDAAPADVNESAWTEFAFGGRGEPAFVLFTDSVKLTQRSGGPNQFERRS